MILEKKILSLNYARLPILLISSLMAGLAKSCPDVRRSVKYKSTKTPLSNSLIKSIDFVGTGSNEGTIILIKTSSQNSL